MSKILANFIASLEAGSRKYMDVFKGDKQFFTRNFLKFLLNSYKHLGQKTLGEDKQRYFYGRFSIQGLLESRFSRLEIKELKDAMVEQFASTVQWAVQLQRSIGQLHSEVTRHWTAITVLHREALSK